MNKSVEISVIIPFWRGALGHISKLIKSIPSFDTIEVIAVDNSKDPVKREEIDSDREIVLMHSAYDRHAGGSRNDGMSVAKGKWLLFADADDYFVEGAFELFLSRVASDADIIYTCGNGVYLDTGERSDRADRYSQLVRDYIGGKCSEQSLRLCFIVPWCKLIRRDFVFDYNLRFDEIVAGNDLYFCITSGYYASKIEAVDQVTYIATVSKGTLTKRHDYDAIKARLYSKLHCNLFLREKGLANRQYSILFSIIEARKYGLDKTIEFVKMCKQFKQNPFVGMSNWGKTLVRKKKDIYYNTR